MLTRDHLGHLLRNHPKVGDGPDWRDTVLRMMINCDALRVASDTEKADPCIVVTALTHPNPIGSPYGALQWASPTIRDSRHMVQTAVLINGLALRDASDRLKADREVVLNAVRQNADALQFASEALRADPEIRRAAKSQAPDEGAEGRYSVWDAAM